VYSRQLSARLPSAISKRGLRSTHASLARRLSTLACVIAEESSAVSCPAIAASRDQIRSVPSVVLCIVVSTAMTVPTWTATTALFNVDL
jgi:hypothetical protein